MEIYEAKIDEVKKLNIDFSIFERNVLLHVVDKFWTDHIDAMNTLRNEIGIMAYGQKDPVVAYKNEGFEMFDKMITDIRDYTAETLFKSQLKIEVVPKRPVGPINVGNTNKGENVQARNRDAHIGRNDLCPCGSGKKYKNCCMNKDQK